MCSFTHNRYPTRPAAVRRSAAAPAARPAQPAQQPGVNVNVNVNTLLHASSHAPADPTPPQACCPEALTLSGGQRVSDADCPQSVQPAAAPRAGAGNATLLGAHFSPSPPPPASSSANAFAIRVAAAAAPERRLRLRTLCMHAYASVANSCTACRTSARTPAPCTRSVQTRVEPLVAHHCVSLRPLLPGGWRRTHWLATSFGMTYGVACASCKWLPLRQVSTDNI